MTCKMFTGMARFSKINNQLHNSYQMSNIVLVSNINSTVIEMSIRNNLKVVTN